MSCKGNCASCSGCGRELELTTGELDFLRLLGECAFLPVARLLGEERPVFPENTSEEYSLMLLCLEKKGLVSLDYHLSMKGYSHPDYDRLPLRGSMALTQRGQKVLELVEYQGILPD